MMNTTCRCTSLGALLLLLVQGCAGADKQPSPEQKAHAEAQPVVEVAAVETDAQGAPYQTIWTRPARGANAPAGAPGGLGLGFTRLAVSDNSFAMHLAVHNHRPGDARAGKTEKPKVNVTVNGCPGPILPVDGELEFDKSSALTLRRGELPKGDLEITISAFEDETTMLVANDEKGLRPITMQELRGYKRTPGDPAKGEPDTFTIEEPECP